MELQEAIEQAKDVLQETFGPEGYRDCRLEGWEDGNDCWVVLLSMEYIPPQGTAAHTLSVLTGGRRKYLKVAIRQQDGGVQGIHPVPDPYAAAQPSHT